MKRPATCACLAAFLVGNASAALVVDLSAASGTDTTVDGGVVSTWQATGDNSTTTFTRSGSDARYVADSGGGIAAIDFDRSAPFLGDITSALGGSTTITDATILVWAHFDEYSHGASASSYYYSIDGSGNEHTLGRDGNSGTDYIYHWDGEAASNGTLQPQPAGWKLYIAKFYATPLGDGTSMVAWIDPVGDGAVVTGIADVTNADSTGYSGNADSVRIGTWTNAGSGLDGQIRGLRIYNELLSDAEIQEAALSMTDVETTTPTLAIAAQGDSAELTWSGTDHLLSSTDLEEWHIEAEATSPMIWTIDEDREFFQLASDFTQIPQGVVLRTTVATYTSRDLEYHVDTGDLYMLGEQTHGLDYYDTSGNDFWWCYMNSNNHGSGLLEFLMDNNLNAAAMKATATSNGWTTYNTGNQYSFLIFEPLAAQKTYVNDEAPAVPGGLEMTEAYTDDYTTIATDDLLFTVYRNNGSGAAYFGMSGPSLDTVVTPRPPGDGTAENDNGLRYDIAFKVNIPLTEEKKLELINRFSPVIPLYNDSSLPYYLVHPPGL